LSWLVLKPQKKPCFEPGCLETAAMDLEDWILQRLSRFCGKTWWIFLQKDFA